jgi:hypothetical protein
VARGELAAEVALEIDSARLTRNELAITQDIARTTARNVAQAVGQALAKSLRHAVPLPRDEALRLVVMVSEDLRRYLLSHHALLAPVAADLALQSPECAAIGLTERASRENLTTLIR